MALPWIEGFGGMFGLSSSNLTAAFARRGMVLTTAGAGESVLTAGGRTYFHQTAANDQDIVTLADAPTWVGFRWNFTGVTASNQYIRIAMASGTVLNIQIRNDGAMYLGLGVTPATLIASGVPDNSFIEIENTGTTFKFYLNGSATSFYTATNTAVIKGMGVIRAVYIGDIYFSATRLGEGSARLIAVTTQDSNTGTVTGAADAAAAMGNANYDDNAKYVTFASGQKAILNLDDITDNPVSIACVQVTALGRKTGTASLPEKVKYVTGAEYDVGSPVLSVSLTGPRVVATLDPHDSAAWTKVKVNSLKVGVGSA